MNRNIIARLVVKDLYMYRWLIGVAIVLGIITIFVSSLSKTAFSVGGTLYLTTIVAYAVVLVMYSVVQERKDKSVLFVLSLPVSGDDYLRAKVLSVLITFIVPWLVLTLGGVTLLATTPIPDGLIPFFVLVSGLMLMNFSLVLVVALLTVSEAVITASIIVTNVSVSLFFIFLSAQPSIRDHLEGPTAVWSDVVFTILTVEVAVVLIAVTLPFYVRRGRSVLI